MTNGKKKDRDRDREYGKKQLRVLNNKFLVGGNKKSYRMKYDLLVADDKFLK